MPRGEQQAFWESQGWGTQEAGKPGRRRRASVQGHPTSALQKGLLWRGGHFELGTAGREEASVKWVEEKTRLVVEAWQGEAFMGGGT